MEIIYYIGAGVLGVILVKIAWYVLCVLTVPDSNDIIHNHPEK